MNQSFKMSDSAASFESDVKALSNSSLLVLIAPADLFDECNTIIKKVAPNTPSIGVTGDGYAGKNETKGKRLLIGFTDCDVIADAVTDISMPMLSLKKLNDNVNKLGGNGDNTVCLDFTTSNDSVLISTLNVSLSGKNISLIGGTAAENKLSINGNVIKDAAVYALIKNKTGKIKAYKENIYNTSENMPTFIATKVNKETSSIVTLDNKPAAKVYCDALGLKNEDIGNQTFKNPIGRLLGDETYIISLKSKLSDGSLECFKKTNPNDHLTILELGDYEQINRESVATMKKDFPNLKGVFSVNCAFRYLLFTDLNYFGKYLDIMTGAGSHAGLVGFGEHYKLQHINQTMSYFAFD